MLGPRCDRKQTGEVTSRKIKEQGLDLYTEAHL